jgi:pimeloyl-ACP methyl ester carboxylesterase
MVGDPVVARVKRDMPGVDARGYAVQYPADGFGFMGNGSSRPSAADIAAHAVIGPNDIIYRLGNQTKECPDEKFALVGYSQGGSVVSNAANILKTKPELADKVLAIVLYGAGDGSTLALPASKVLANCARGDLVSVHGVNAL